MRYADGPVVESEILVHASPEVLWPMVTDLELLASLSPELQRVELLDGAGVLAGGVRFRGHSRHRQVGEWSTVSTVTMWEPLRRFGWEVERDRPEGAAASWLFELTPAGDDTAVRQWARLGPGSSGLTPAIERWPDKEERIVAGRIEEWRSAIDHNLSSLKESAER